MTLKKSISYALIAAAILVSGCSQQENPVINEPGNNSPGQEDTPNTPVTYAPISLTNGEQAMMEVQNGFGIELLKTAAVVTPDENLVYSLPGITGTLSMSANLVTGDAQHEIREALGIGENQIDALNTLNSRVANLLSYVDEDVKTSVANSIWFDTRIKPKTNFISAMENSYKADIFNEKLSDIATINKINCWASEKTDGMIDRFLDSPLDNNYDLLSVNALYFNGGWTDKFDKELTKEDVFICHDGTMSDIMMMHNSGLALPYMESKDAKWLKLHFGNNTFAITFIMPSKDINEYITNLTKADIDRFNTIEETPGVRISIPRMSLGTTCDNIVDILKKMGISKIFDGNADYTPLTGYAINGLGSSIVQKTKFEINEEGAKAAGVVGNGCTMLGPDQAPELPSFILNRPFVFILSEEASNTTLFIGRIMKF